MLLVLLFSGLSHKVIGEVHVRGEQAREQKLKISFDTITERNWQKQIA